MYRMSHDIVIGGRRLRLLEKVVIKRSVENLADTATITLPAYHLGHPVSLKNKKGRQDLPDDDPEGKDLIRPGDEVTIKFGYDGQNETEFTGYVDDVTTTKDGIEIRCMDELWNFKNTPVKDEVHGKIRLKQLLERICQQVNPEIEIDCDYDIGYKDFVIRHSTAYDVLRQIQEETKADIYFKGHTLHCHAPYAVVNHQTAKFDFARNIETYDLKYIRAEDRPVEVEVTIRKPDGEPTKITYGTTGAKKISLRCTDDTTATAQKLAKEQHGRLTATGYEGSITGWLIPYVEPGMAISLHDKDIPDRDGKYYVIATETTYSRSGGQRKITLGRRLDIQK